MEAVIGFCGLGEVERGCYPCPTCDAKMQPFALWGSALRISRISAIAVQHHSTATMVHILSRMRKLREVSNLLLQSASGH
jgi:hypothetical protein